MDCKTVQQMILPYIQRKLNDKELEKFIDHIKGCSDCHEELEIYFTIYFALERLDEGGQVSYNIQKLLVDDLRSSEHRVHMRKLMRIYRYCFMAVAEVVLFLILFSQIQMWSQKSSIQQTSVYQFIYGRPMGDEDKWLVNETQIFETERTTPKNKKNNPNVQRIPETEKNRGNGKDPIMTESKNTEKKIAETNNFTIQKTWNTEYLINDKNNKIIGELYE